MANQIAFETYRFFAVDHADVVLWDRCVQCMDDADARASAIMMAADGNAIEVWDVARFVAKVDVTDA